MRAPTLPDHRRLLALMTLPVVIFACDPGKGEGSAQGSVGGGGADGAADGAADGGAGDGGAGGADSSPPDDPRLALALPAPGNALTDRAATPEVCAQCHNNSAGADAMRDSAANPISPYFLQHGTMMANAGRDPIFWATLAAEIQRAPALQAEIEGACFGCHAPMGKAEAAATGRDPLTVDDLRAGRDNASELALDGVSCASCHRLDPVGLGAEDTWSGHLRFEPALKIYGPHASPLTTPMEMHTGFTPTRGDHVLESELCAGCHVLQTPTLEGGAPTGGHFLEQATYLEWLASDYTAEGATPRSCQSCHMPTSDGAGDPIETAIARAPSGGDFPIDARRPFGQHEQVGGNTWGLALLRDHADVLQPRANTTVFNDTIDRARAMLQTAARLEGEGLRVEDGVLRGELIVYNDTGHKLPTGYPSRRAWLALELSDASGAVRLQVGEVDATGAIVGEGGVALPAEVPGGPTYAHVSALRSAEAPLVYELVMQNSDGQPTTELLSAAARHKDSRLLPAGWRDDRLDTPVGDLRPVGLAGDLDFGGGGDRVQLELPVAGGAGPYTLRARLRYQPVSPRWAAGIIEAGTPEGAALGAMMAVTPLSTETLVEVSFSGL